jgi:hypothetical protein
LSGDNDDIIGTATIGVSVGVGDVVAINGVGTNNVVDGVSTDTNGREVLVRLDVEEPVADVCDGVVDDDDEDARSADNDRSRSLVGATVLIVCNDDGCNNGDDTVTRGPLLTLTGPLAQLATLPLPLPLLVVLLTIGASF